MPTTIREAQVKDIPHLAYVSLQATSGLFDALYEGSIPGRETPLIVEHMFSRLNTTSSYLNCRILEVDGQVVGGLHGFPQSESEKSVGDPLMRRDRFNLLKPFYELPIPKDSYYIHSVGLYPEQRGQGHGHELMLKAEEIAKSLQVNSTSLHVFQQNTQALALYLGMGYTETGRSPVVPHPSLLYDGQLLLLEKTLAL